MDDNLLSVVVFDTNRINAEDRSGFCSFGMECEYNKKDESGNIVKRVVHARLSVLQIILLERLLI